MTDQALASKVVEKMLAADAFSRWLGISVLEVTPGRAIVRMTVREDMVNGFGTSHGGIVYSLADSAFAFATNNTGQVSVAVDCTISYPRAVHPGDELVASAIVESNTNKLAFCEVTVHNQQQQVVGFFRGTVYRTHNEHFPEQGRNA